MSTKTDHPIHHQRSTCRACGSRRLEVFLDLGPQPLANAYPATAADFADEMFFPLDVAFCADCTLVQIVDVVDPEVLFGHYLYVTGTSTSMAEHWRGYAQSVVEEYRLSASDRVVEVASNDGSLLLHFKNLGTRTLGIEPARNIAAMARERGIETVNRFFNATVGQEIREAYGPSRAAIANNVLAHVDHNVDFLRGLAALVSQDGVVVVEAPYLGEFIEKLEYDTVYHEHLSYFSVTALAAMYERAGLGIVRIQKMPVHGGSLRIWARPHATAPKHAREVEDLMADEKRRGFTTSTVYQYFAEGVRKNREKLKAMLGELKAQGKSIAAYGAPAKGNTLLNYCGLSTQTIAFTVDKNPLKVGRFTPGMHLPILPVEELAARRPDYALILPWNLSAEIIRQEEVYRRAGGRFIIPIPEPRLVEA